MKTVWNEVLLSRVQPPADGGWRNVDPATTMKLATSVRRFGQLRPLVVRLLASGMYDVVEGKQIYGALVACGAQMVTVLEVVEATDDELVQLALALGIVFETDYSKVAAACGALLEKGITAEYLAAASPFSADRIGYFKTLCSFDWAEFAVDDEQHAMNWTAQHSEDEVLLPLTDDEQAAAEPPPQPPPPPIELELAVVSGTAEPQFTLF